jgi:copper transport protein
MAWRDIGTLGALTATTYGRLVLAKIAGLCVLIALGYLARRRIGEGLQPSVAAQPAAELITAGPPARVKAGAGVSPGRGAGRTARGNARGNGRPGRERAEAAGQDRAGGGSWPDTERVGVTLRRLRWSVAAETVVAATVLAVTAVLVNTPTARESYFAPAVATASFDTGGPGGRGTVRIVVTPAGLGPNRFRISVTGSTGKPYRPQQLQAGLWLPARHLGPLAVRLARAGPGRYLGGPVVVAAAGEWQLQLTIRSDAFDEATIALPFPVH